MRIILFFFIFSFLQIQSQTTIKGTIKDSLQNPVSLVNVRLYNKLDNVLIDFKQSNNLGQFELVCPDAETKIFLLKASFLGYKPVVFEFSTDGNRSIIEKNIILKNEVVAMKEVVIKADFRDVNEKNDTITFNLKRLLNGSEQKLKDVIKKLPGLSIDKNGKIRYQGKKIDDVLIDGHEFFGTQHQLATENLKSEMIEKIEILKNFKNLSSITGFDNNKRTALNLSLKNQYKNTIKGDVSQEYGYKKSYRQHNTIYNFGGKIKVNVITDVNNTNNPAFTVTDYLELKKGIQNELSSENSTSSITVDEDVPSFLFATDNVNAKEIRFYSVNFSDKISKTSKVKYSSMLNYIKQSEFLQAKQNFFSATDIIIDKNSSIAGKSLFSTNKISYEYKPNENNYFNYVLAVNYSANKRINLVRTILATNQANFDDNKNNVDTGVGQFFSHKIKLNDKFLFEYNLFADFTSFTKHLNITANQPFFNLKFNEDFLLNQRTDGYNNSLGVNSKLRIKNQFGTLFLNAGSSLKNDSFNNFLDDLNPQFSTELNLVRTNNYLGVNFSKKKIYKFNYALGARLEYVQFEHNSERADNLVFLPSANFSYEVSNEININLNYKRDFSNVTIDKVITGMLIEDYRTVFRSKNVFYNSILPKNTITLNGSFSSSRTGLRSFFGLVYTDKITDVGFNTFNSENISIREYDYIDLDNSKYLFFTIEKKLKSIPWSAKLETLQSFSKRESFINSNATTFGTNQTKLDVTLLSYFKSNDFNVSLGLEYLVNSSVNDSNKEKSQLNTVAALFAFNGVVFKDKLNWDLESKIIHFDSANSKQKDVFELNPSITYSIKDWKFMLRGVNILNIRDNNTRLRVNNSDFYFEAQQYSSLAGFVTTGFSYSF